MKYEIEQSWKCRNGLMGVYIHNIKDRAGDTAAKGQSPFSGYNGIQTYDWCNDVGYDNLGTWVEAAYQRAQNRK